MLCIRRRLLARAFCSADFKDNPEFYKAFPDLQSSESEDNDYFSTLLEKHQEIQDHAPEQNKTDFKFLTEE